MRVAPSSSEFAFKLIQVANYNDTRANSYLSPLPTTSSAWSTSTRRTTFPATSENPSCLAYTKPGTYYYRVIEDTSKGRHERPFRVVQRPGDHFLLRSSNKMGDGPAGVHQ
ncbi:MAG: hypothetical protein ACLTSX_13840 [Collinsella sp.]